VPPLIRPMVDFFYRWIAGSKMWYPTAGNTFYNEIYGRGGSGNVFIRQLWRANAVAQSSAPPTKHKAFPLPNGKRIVVTNQGVRMF